MALRLGPASGAALDLILRETHPLWGGGLAFDAYARYQAAERRTVWGGTHIERMALFDGPRVLASAKRFDLAARVDGRIRRVLGLGAIVTPRELRGRGAASALLAHLVDAGNTEGYEFALLFTASGAALYERLEFVPLPLATTSLRVLTKDGAPAMLVRAGDDKDLPYLTELCLTRAAGSRFALDRTEDYIRHAISKRRLQAGLGPAGLRQVEFLVAEEGHMAVAYLVCSVYNGAWTIEEAGDRDPSGARLGAMLQVMLAREPSLAPPAISGFWPHDLRPPQLEVTGVRPSEEVMMIRPLRDRTLPMPPLGPADIAYWHSDLF